MSNDGGRWVNMPPSSSGLGHLSFKEATGIRLPLGVGYYTTKGSFLYHVLPINPQLNPQWALLESGSMPERLMGTDCKFVGNMSTLVQIQLGPTILQYTPRWYNPPVLQKYPIRRNKNKKESKFLLDPFFLFPWDCSSIGQSTALSRRKLRVRAPSVPTDSISTSIIFPFSVNTGTGIKISFPRGLFFLSLFVLPFSSNKKK